MSYYASRSSCNFLIYINYQYLRALSKILVLHSIIVFLPRLIFICNLLVVSVSSTSDVCPALRSWNLDTSGCRHRHARSISYEVPAADAQHPLVGSYHQRRGTPANRPANNQRNPTQPSPVSFRPRCTPGPWSPSKQGLALDGEQSWGQEAIDKLDQTSRPSSSHLAQPCPRGC